MRQSFERVIEGMKKLLEKEVSEDFPQEAKEKRIGELKRQEKQMNLKLKGCQKVENSQAIKYCTLLRTDW